MSTERQNYNPNESGQVVENKDKKGKFYVEVGSGGIPAFGVSNRKLESGDKYIMVDVNLDSYLASDDYAGAMGGGFEAILGDGTDIPIPDNEADEFIFNNVMGDPKNSSVVELLKEAEKKLKIGGRVVITEYITPEVFLEKFGDDIEKISEFLSQKGINLKVDKFSFSHSDVGSYGGKLAFLHSSEPFQLILVK